MSIQIHTEVISGSEAAGCQRVALMAVGPDPEVAQAAQYLQTLTPLFEKSDPPGALTAPLTWPLIVQMSATFGPAFAPGRELCRWVEAQILARTSPLADELPAYVQIPAGLTPRPYQVAGALEIARTGSALIFDEPRTGKTMTTILGLAVNAGPDQLDGLPILVVCPASVVDPWVEAFNTWTPHWRAVAWRGPKRKELATCAEVYVTSYETARIDAPPSSGARGKKVRPLIELEARSLVIDETHLIKNATAARSTAVRRLARKVTAKGGAVIGLSGTPITHHVGDLWPTLEALQSVAWPAKERVVKRYFLTLPGNAQSNEDQILGLHPAVEPEFRLAITGQHRRVARADVMSQLPPKVYSVRTVDLPAEWRKAYDEFEDQMLAELPSDDGGFQELSVMDTLSMLSHLRALSAAAADVEVTYGPDVDKVTGEPKRHVHLDLKAPSWKVDALLEILDERCEPGRRDTAGESMVTFAPSAQLMHLAGAAAAAAGYRVGYVIGGQSQGARTETIRSFQAGELDLVCATTGAGGTGITLSRAGTLVFLQRPWSLVESLQAEDRAEGDMEAIRGTEVIDVIARNTLDTRIRAVLKQRAGQLADLVQDRRIVTELLGGSSVSELEQRKAS